MDWYHLLLLFIGSSDAYRILALLPYPGKSHYLFFEPILNELTQRGHNLTIVSFFPPKESHPNRREVSLVGLAPLNVEVLDLKEFDRSYFGLEKYTDHVLLCQALAKSNLNLCEKLLNATVFDEFLKGQGEYDVILVEHFNSDCMFGLMQNYDAPTVGLVSSVMLPWTMPRAGAPDNPAYVPGMTLPFTEKMNFFERIINGFFQYYYLIWFEIEIRWKEQILLENKMGHKLKPLVEVAKNASVVLVNSYHVLNGPRVVPPSIVEVGGIHLHNKTVMPLPEDLDRWVSEPKEGFILVSFGSLIRGSSLPEERFRSMIKVFSRLPQRVIWKWETEDIKDLPSNVLVMRWLPQYDLLNHPNCVAFITHGGLLSLTEAVATGIPVVTVPVLGDQFGNAAHAHEAGIAEVVRLQDLDEAHLGPALDKVLTPEVRSRAKYLSQQWWERPVSPMELAIHHIEKTAKYKGLNMSSHARNMSRIELYMLDVLALVGAIVLAMVYSVMRLCRKSEKKLKQS